MYEEFLFVLRQRPLPYEKSTAAFWNDPHVSKGMLAAHLDPHLQAASREHAFVDRSVNWIASAFPPSRYPKLCDLGCGPGIYAERFCKKGYEVSGVDLSERSINYALHSAKEQGLSIDYRLLNYLTLSDRASYDLMTLIYCDFGVLCKEDRATVLCNAFSALKPGGALLLDAFTAREYKNRREQTSIQVLDEGFWSDEPHAFIHSFFRYDMQRVYCDRYIVLTDACLRHYLIWNHAFDAAELACELNDAGFERVELFGDVAGAPFTNRGRILCALAHKPG
jgi:SAM-dependent methyltransferase